MHLNNEMIESDLALSKVLFSKENLHLLFYIGFCETTVNSFTIWGIEKTNNILAFWILRINHQCDKSANCDQFQN